VSASTGQMVGRALRDTLISPNEADSNLEPANVVDGLFAIARAISDNARALDRIADALITRPPMGGEPTRPAATRKRWRVSEAELERTMRGAS
jgi:hypothetical protein